LEGNGFPTVEIDAAACIASMGRGEVTEEDASAFYEHTYRRAYTHAFLSRPFTW